MNFLISLLRNFYLFEIPTSLAFIYTGKFTAFSSRVGPESEAPANDEKRVPVEASDSSKPSNGYLGRDTIANAAARIGPAVVNLSVPQS